MRSKIPYYAALLPIIMAVSMMIITVTYLHIPLFIPLFVGYLITLLTAIYYKVELKKILIESKNGIKSISMVFLVLLLIGVLIAMWSSSGTIDALVYYGLGIIRPEHIIVTSFLISAVISMLLGTSVGTASTVGVAFMGMAHSLDINPAIVAGALVSGAFVGDRTSPLSAVANINNTITETNYYDNIRELFKTLIPAFILTIIAYVLIEQGNIQLGDGSVNLVDSARKDLLDLYGEISPLLLLPPLSIIILASLKVSIRINLLVGSLIGGALAYIFQGRGILDLLYYSIFGYGHPNGNVFGGGWNMFNQILLIIIAGAFYGLLESSGILSVILEKITKGLNSAIAIIQKTIIISIAATMLTSTQVMGIIIPGKVMLKYYRDFSIQPKLLSRVISDSGMLIAGLIPWNLNAILLGTALHIPVMDYVPYAYFLMILPIYSYLQIRWNLFKRKNIQRGI